MCSTVKAKAEEGESFLGGEKMLAVEKTGSGRDIQPPLIVIPLFQAVGSIAHNHPLL